MRCDVASAWLGRRRPPGRSSRGPHRRRTGSDADAIGRGSRGTRKHSRGDPVYGGGRIDRRTGEVWPQPAIDYAVEMGDEDQGESESSERWLRVECLGSVESYRDMEFFIGGVEDASEANRLTTAIDGRGAFRRFRDALDDWPEELDRWHAISEDRQRGRARVWLAERGYCVSPGPQS